MTTRPIRCRLTITEQHMEEAIMAFVGGQSLWGSDTGIANLTSTLTGKGVTVKIPSTPADWNIGDIIEITFTKPDTPELALQQWDNKE